MPAVYRYARWANRCTDMRKAVHSRKTDAVFVLAVFCAFAASVLLVLMLGANAYKSMVEKSGAEYDRHTGLSYIWTKVKNTDAAGKVYIDEFHDMPVLCLEEEYDTETFRTIIYLYDGWVRELFSEEGLEFPPEAGITILEAESLAFDELENGLIKVTLDSQSLLISPRSRTGLSYTG